MRAARMPVRLRGAGADAESARPPSAARGAVSEALEQPTVRRRLDPLVALATAGVVLALGLSGGAYSQEARGILAIALWWAVAVTVALGLSPFDAVSRLAIVTWSLLAAFTVFTGLSLLWATSDERAFAEFDRVGLYLGLYTVVVLARTHGTVGRWADGLALGIVAITVVALASRFLPQVVSGGAPLQFAWGSQSRLNYPVGYWTGLGVLVGMAVPLLLRAAAVSRTRVVRAAAVGTLPLLSAALYLTSTRLGTGIAVGGAILFFALAPRWDGALALIVGAAASAAAVAVVASFPELVNGPFESAAEAAGWRASLLLVSLGAAAATVFAIAVDRLPSPPPLPRRGAVAAYVVAGLAAVILVVALHPRQRFESFRSVPADLNARTAGSHLLSGSSNGRWQLWMSAIDEAKTEPVRGRGAGSFEAWWAMHGRLPVFAKDAHSLFFETAGELGLVGLFLVAAALASGVVAGVRRLRRTRGGDRVLAAALLSTFVAYLVSASGDWMWEFTIVSAIAVVCLGLLTGDASGRPRPVRSPGAPLRRVALRAALVAVALAAIVAQAIPLLADSRIRESQAAAHRGRLSDATSAALAAVSIQPWAASPYRQVALVEEREGRLASAHDWIVRAIRRDRTDWRLWFIRTRIETTQGNVHAALRSLAVLERLNPHSRLFER